VDIAFLHNSNVVENK